MDATPKNSLLLRLNRSVDGSSLAVFRIAYGAIMLWEAYRYWANDWIAKYWIKPEFHFKYKFFEWVTPWSGDGMYTHFAVMALLSVFVMLGLFYRASAVLLCLSIVYVFLLEQAKYLNHIYLVSLISFLAIFLPANRMWSIDAWIRPSKASSKVPTWALWLVRFQVAVPYFFGGIAKLNGDWLAGEPLRDWLPPNKDFPLIGRYFNEEWMIYAFSYSGLLIDLFICFFLLWRPTRGLAFLTIAMFHMMNTRLFNIGIFPWFMLAATTIYFEPNWPRKILNDIWGQPNRKGVIALLGLPVGCVLAIISREGCELLPMSIGGLAGALVAWSFYPESPSERNSEVLTADAGPLNRVFAGGLAAWIAVQVLLPLRHYVIDGNVHWTEDGHRFSWHMKLRGKEGSASFVVKNPVTGKIRRIAPDDELKSWQLRKMSTRPYMILQYAKHLAQTMREDEGWEDVEVYCQSTVSLNGRANQQMIDSHVDLSREPYPFGRSPWVKKLTVPLKGK